MGALLALAMLALSGCLLRFPLPEINLWTEAGYNGKEILIPYELRGDGAEVSARWSLEHFDDPASSWKEVESRQVRLPNGSSGVIQLDELAEGKYRLTFELLTTRDGSYEPVSYLTQVEEFFVDMAAPVVWDLTLQYYNDDTPAAAPMAGAHAELEVTYTPPSFNPDVEAPVEIVYTLNDLRMPVNERDVLQGRILLWESTEANPSADILLAVVDDAGNRSGVRAESWAY
jgi:hypothetical protein